MHTLIRRAAILAGLLSVPAYAYSAEWTVAPYFGVRGEYDDNIRLLTVGHDTAWGTTVTPGIEIDKATVDSRTAVSGFLDIIKYSKDINLDRTDKFLNVAYRNDVTELDDFKFRARYKGDTLLRDILINQSTLDLGVDPQDTDIGTVAVQVRRQRVTLDPEWRHRWTKKTAAGVHYGYTNVSYNDTFNTNLTEYQNHRVLLNLEYKRTERLIFAPAVSASKYRPDNGGSGTNNYTVSMRARRILRENLQTSAEVGYRKTHLENAPGSADSSGVVLNAELVRGSETGVLVSSLRREVIPSSEGSSKVTDQLNLRWRRKISPLQTVIVRARAFRDKSLDPALSDRSYIDIVPRYRWKLNREWSIDAAYEYRWQKFKNSGDTAVNNTLYLGVAYYQENVY